MPDHVMTKGMMRLTNSRFREWFDKYFDREWNALSMDAENDDQLVSMLEDRCVDYISEEISEQYGLIGMEIRDFWARVSPPCRRGVYKRLFPDDWQDRFEADMRRRREVEETMDRLEREGL
jgi:hypothetical protein